MSVPIGTTIPCSARDCDVPFTTRSAKHLYCCDECLRRETAYNKTDNEALVPIGSEIHCDECGEILIKAAPTQTMHPECSRERTKRRNHAYKQAAARSAEEPVKKKIAMPVAGNYETRRVYGDLWPDWSGVPNISTTEPAYCPFWTNEVKEINL